MNYNHYSRARDASWEIIIRFRISALPVQVSGIARGLGMVLIPYSKAPDSVRGIIRQQLQFESDGFLIRDSDAPTIYYNDRCSIGRQRFTVAHELGHYVLRHPGSRINREPRGDDPDDTEAEANVFAARLLAPACVLWGMGLRTTTEIARVCGISLTSAAFRAERMEALYAREQEYIASQGRSCFLLSPQERRVFAQFRDYIVAST